MTTRVAVVLTCWAGAGGLAAQAETSGLSLTPVRFYRDSGSQTLVHLFWQVPLALLQPLSEDPGRAGAYRVTVRVEDSTGLQLLQQSWAQTVSGSVLAVPGGSAAESFTFAARPGRYRVTVAITDSATGRLRREETELATYRDSPGASDLLLASDIRAATPGDTAHQPGELRKGDLLLRTTGRPVLTPHQPRLGYYVEVYSQRAETVALMARVVGATGASVLTTQPQRVALAQAGGVGRGLLDLGGLSRGAYRLELMIRAGDRQIVRTAPFGMAGFETDRVIAEVPGEPRDVFDQLSEVQLDTLYLPLVYLMTEQERGVYPSLSVTGKRSYLQQFWAKRDPTPGTLPNEARVEFYARIADANRRFREGGAAEIPGWRTDRGRIFIKHGLPDEVLQRPQAGNTSPYEVWKYTRGRALKYVFLDLTQFGNFALIFTNDRREPSRPNWQALLGPEAVLDVQRF